MCSGDLYEEKTPAIDRKPTAGARAAYVQMPSATSPGILLLGAGAGLTVMGAAMLSHARRLRS